MSAATIPSFATAVSRWQASFLAMLPGILLQAHSHFCAVRCPHRHEDAVAETVALAWRWYVSLSQRGKNPDEFIGALTTFAARRVCVGRGLCGQEKAKDALSAVAQRRNGFVVVSLPNGSSRNNTTFDEALRDNTQTDVGEQVAFRLDFPAWRARHSDRDRRVIDDPMVGERPLDVANRYGLASSRVSQLRRAFHRDWQTFCGERATDDAVKV